MIVNYKIKILFQTEFYRISPRHIYDVIYSLQGMNRNGIGTDKQMNSRMTEDSLCIEKCLVNWRHGLQKYVRDFIWEEIYQFYEYQTVAIDEHLSRSGSSDYSCKLMLNQQPYVTRF